MVPFLAAAVPILAALLAWLGWMTRSSNLLGWLLILIGGVYFAGVILTLWIRRPALRSSPAEKPPHEEGSDRSFAWITAGLAAVIFAAPAETLWFQPALSRVLWLQAAGLALVTAGAALFLWARMTLGKHFSGHLAVGQDQPLVQSGPYRLVRHPAYAGYLLVTLGLVVGYASRLAAALYLVLLLPAVVYRIRVEDRLLAEHFGPAFRAYAARVKRLVPHLW